MLVLRPIRESDLPGLVALAGSTGGGVTTLPANEALLAERIQDSVQAFHPRVHKPGGEYYLFGMEDTADGALLGVSGIAARVGGFYPWYSYEIREERFVHRPLKIEKTVQVLHLKEDHRGPTEVCSLFLRADRRRSGAGRLLSLARFLFIGTHPQRFTESVIAEMRGYIDQTGLSPFWEAVGRHFFPFDFYAADFLSGLGEKDFIADLMPRHPLYVPLLPPTVQAAIGRVHHDTEPALALLTAEGFARTNEVDIFDAGPQLRATVANIRTVRLTRTANLRGTHAAPPPGEPHLLAQAGLDFRACLGGVQEHDDGTVSITPDCAEALQLGAGDRLAWAPLR